MKKIKKLSKIIPLISMIVFISTGCEKTSDTEPHPTRMESEQPLETETMSTLEPTASDVEDEEKDENTPEQHDHLKWRYDRKNKRLTISGIGDMREDTEDDEGLVGYSPDHFYPKHTNFSKIKNNVKEIVVKPGVTSIASEAFCDFYQVEKIILPDTIQKIGDKVFWYCQSLKEIVIPKQVKTIGNNCFCLCKSLQKITIGKSLRKIGEGAFVCCPNIRQVRVSPENKYLMAKNGGLYEKREKTLYLHFGKSERVIIEKDTKHIAACAIQWNEKVKRITIPASVLTINGGALCYCSNLKNIVFPKQSRLREIMHYSCFDGEDAYGYGCFEGCKKLQEFIAPESLEQMSDGHFYGCDSLKRIYLGKSFKGVPGETPQTPEEYQHYQAYKYTENSPALEEYIVSKDNKIFCSKDGVLYDKKLETLFVYPSKKKATEYTIPASVKYVIEAWDKKNKLRKLIVPSINTEFRWMSKNMRRLTVYGRKDSAAYRMAKKRNIRFKSIPQTATFPPY